MPNWIEGTLKLRGNVDDILHFLREGLNVYRWNGPTFEDYYILDRSNWYTENDFRDGGCGTIDIGIKNAEPYIEGTSRAFVKEQDVVYIAVNKNSLAVVCMDVKQAWGFETKEFLNISQRYNLDIRAYGIESGMQFCQEFEIVDGKIIFDKITKYDDWTWECPFPTMGG